MSSVIRQLKNWFTKQNIYPQTVEQAIYDSEGRRLDNKIANGLSNPNLLINADFRNPVNQRGETSHSSSGYWIDRWEQYLDFGIISLTTDGISIDASSTPVSLRQKLESPDKYLNRTMTFSICIRLDTTDASGTIYIGCPNVTNEVGLRTTGVDGEFRVVSVTFTLDSYNTFIAPSIYLGKGKATVMWAKLEEGEIATPFRPRLYAEELQLCKRYFQVIYQNAINIPWYDDNNFRFYIQFEQRMRSVPTVIFPSNSVVVFGQYKNSSAPIIDATVKADEINQSKCRLVITKKNHGYPSAELHVLGIWVDAEL